MWNNIALVLGAYFLGSAPHLLALGKLCNVTMDGDLHINLWRRGGRLVGFIGILLDMAKGVTPVLVGKGLGFDLAVVTLAGIAVVVGQMWPVFSRFHGEKGNSTGLAMALALVPKALAIALVPIVIGAGFRTVPRMMNTQQSLNERLQLGGPPSRSLPLGMAIGFLVLPLASWWLGQPSEVTLGCGALFVLIVLRRLTNRLKGDIEADTSVLSTLLNRLLYDRSRL